MSIIAQRFQAADLATTFELKWQEKPVIGLSAGESDFDTPENKIDLHDGLARGLYCGVEKAHKRCEYHPVAEPRLCLYTEPVGIGRGLGRRPRLCRAR